MSLVSPDTQNYKSAYLRALLEENTRMLKRVVDTADAAVEHGKQRVKEAQARRALDNIRNSTKAPISFRKATAAIADVRGDASLTGNERQVYLNLLKELVK